MELAKVYDELYGMIEDLRKQIGSGGGGNNYNKLKNRPQVNGNLLTGDKNSKQLNIAEEMTEAAYAALASKNENEIYFLTENAPIFTESATVAASGITWSAGEDPDTYIATLSYSVVDTDTTGVVGVTCDNELITIGDPTYSTGAVSVPMICADPTAITGDIEFIFTLEQPEGSVRIVKDGLTYSAYSNYSTIEHIVGKWIDGRSIYEKTISVGALPNSSSKTVSHGISNLDYVINVEAVASSGAYMLPLSYVTELASDGVDIFITPTEINVMSKTDRSQYDETYVTLKYVKAN